MKKASEIMQIKKHSKNGTTDERKSISFRALDKLVPSPPISSRREVCNKIKNSVHDSKATTSI